MPRHNNREMRDMICIYVQENYSCLAAARRYREMYPNRVQHGRKTFSNIFNRLGGTGQFKPKSDVGRPKNLTVDEEDDILVRIADNPELSIRRIAAMTGMSERGEEAISDQTLADLIYLAENEGKLRLDSFGL